MNRFITALLAACLVVPMTAQTCETETPNKIGKWQVTALSVPSNYFINPNTGRGDGIYQLQIHEDYIILATDEICGYVDRDEPEGMSVRWSTRVRRVNEVEHVFVTEKAAKKYVEDVCTPSNVIFIVKGK